MGWEECKGRAEDVLSRIIPKFGGSGILDAAAIAHVGRGIGGALGGGQNLRGHVPDLSAGALSLGSQVRGRVCLV